jgi:hypothetical protein
MRDRNIVSYKTSKNDYVRKKNRISHGFTDRNYNSFDVQDKYHKPTYVQDQYCKMDIVESIIFGQFGYPIFEGIFSLHN